LTIKNAFGEPIMLRTNNRQPHGLRLLKNHALGRSESVPKPVSALFCCL
jgi:hypothetical protein